MDELIRGGWLVGGTMTMCKCLTRFLRFCTPGASVVVLAVLALSSPAYCDEIHDAAKNGDLAKVKALLNANPALVSGKDNLGLTPLHYAALNGRKDVAELLLSNKAEVDARENAGNTPLDEAAYGGHKDLAELLLSNKAEVNAKNTNGDTPLHWAALGGHKEAVELLLTNKADVNAKNKSGDTPLHLAAFVGQQEAAQALMASGADANAKNNNDGTPLQLAASKGHMNLLKLLLADGAEVNAKDKNGKTAVMYAATAPRRAMGYADSVNSLVAAGADVTTRSLKEPELIEWKSFGVLLATQADINKLGPAPRSSGVPGSSTGGFIDPYSLVISGYVRNGDALIMNLMFVGEDAVDVNGKPIGISKFTLKSTTPEMQKVFPGVLSASMSEARGEVLYRFSGPRGETNLIRVGSEITLPSTVFAIAGGKIMRNGKVIVRKEGLEIEPGTEVLPDDWPTKPK